MADAADDWAPVATKPDDDWAPVNKPEAPTWGNVSESIPEAFLDRVRAGQAISRILTAAGHEAKQPLAGATPTGFQDETLNYLIDKGIFHDPAKGSGGPIHMVNEAVMMPVAQGWQALMGALAAGIHGAGGAVGQMVEEFGGSQGTANRAKNEVINAANWAMIEGGMGRFSRPHVEPQVGVTERVVGGLPVEADFANAAKVLYHGTNREFKEFDAGKLQSASGSRDAAHGFYFTDDPEIASFFADSPKKGRIIAAELDIKNPKTIELTPESGLDKSQSVKDAFDAGHDAVIFKNSSEGKGPVTTTYVVKGADQIQQRETHLQYIDANLRRMWKEDGITPAEAVHDAQGDAFLKHEITAKQVEIKLDPADVEVLTETGGKPASLGAAASDPPLVPLDVQPAKPPGRMLASAQQAAERLFDVGRDIQMKLAPMARGTVESMATVKDYMNAMRRNAWDSARIDADTMKRFSPEQHARMANAMEEESLSLRLGEPAAAREHQGLATLTPEERAFVVEQDARQQLAWLRARDLGMVEGDGVAMHYPRMVVGIPKGLDRGGEGSASLTAIGHDLRSNTPYLRQRKHLELEETERAVKDKIGMQLALQGKSVDQINAALEKVKVVRDIRAVNIATKALEDAVAGRTLIENIKDVGKRTGEDVVAEGFRPDPTWFTVDHPAFRTWRPKLGEVDGKFQALKDAEGKPIFEQVPIYVRGEFEGPLRAAMWGKSGEAYGAMMSLKGKTMSLIMNSPMIHNFVEFGRAFATMPIKMMTLKVYRDGYRAKHDVALMHEAIDAGMVPIGKRFFNQDINAVMEAPDLTPGRSTTSSIISFIPGIFDSAAEIAVKRAVDKAGDFWHNTLLWDRIADLQTGLYVNIRAERIAKGTDPQTASRIAAHYANRYAGALPKEAMSEAATKVANFALFSRSFTLGNLGVMKDMLTGLPKDVLAQIERDAGFRAGSIEAGIDAGKAAASSAAAIARRKAVAVVAFDLFLMHIGNSLWQNISNVMLGQGGWTEEGHEYLRKIRGVMDEGKVHPLSLLNPFHIAEKVSATADNEPGRKDRVQVGYAKDGTAIYARNPVGKIGEEFSGYFGSPLDMLRKKEGTVLRPALQVLFNDAGFGRKIYDPKADSALKQAANIWAIVKHMAGAQVPEGQITAFSDLVGVHPSNLLKGESPFTAPEGDAKVNAMQAFGPFAGVTFSKGAPGGPAVGEMYDAKNQYQFAVDQALPDIRRQISRGDLDGAMKRMDDLNVAPALQRYYVKTTLDPSLRMSPRAVRDFYRYATPEQRARFDRARQAAPPP